MDLTNQILFIIIFVCLFCILYNYFKHRDTKLLDQKFYNVDEIFPNLNKIKDDRNNILKELKNIMDEPWQMWPEKELYRKGEWKIYPLFAFDIWVDDNCKKMETLTKFIKSIPGLKLATLSKMSGNMELTPHRGWGTHSNNVLRCHYGLNIPSKNSCYIAVSETDYSGLDSSGPIDSNNIDVNYEKQYHSNNEWLVFDDSKTHWAVNNSTEDRIVLIIDIERPQHVKKGTSVVGDTKELIDIVNYFKAKNLIKK